MAVNVMSITEILNIWNDYGVFSYVIPFLLIFAVLFAVLVKTNILGHDKRKNQAMEGIVAAAIALLSLQFDMVSDFFSVIFPRFGVGLSIFLVLIIMLAFFKPRNDSDGTIGSKWIGWVVGIGVAIWSISEWDNWYGVGGFGGWFSEYIWAIIVLGGLIAIIAIFMRNSSTSST